MIKSVCIMFCVAATLSGPLNAAQTIDQIAARPELNHAIFAGEVYDLDTHRVLYARNANTFMESASNTKLLSIGTSLALLGPAFRYTTPVYRTGPIDSAGTLHGDVVLVASGDPNLSQRIQPDGTLAFVDSDHEDGGTGTADAKTVPGDPLAVLRDLAAQVARAGVKRVNGRVAVDVSLFTDHGVGPWSTLLSPVVVNDNIVDLTVKAGAKPGDAATIAVSPQTPYVTVVSKMVTCAPGCEYVSSNSDVRNADGSRTVTLSGTIPAGYTILDNYPVPEPETFAAMAFAQALKEAGVTVDTAPNPPPFSHDTAAPSYVQANRIAVHVSPPLSQDARITLKVSQNVHAALQPVLWGVYVAHAKSDALNAGFAQERALLMRSGLDVDAAAQQDGDGAFGFFTPDFLVHYLDWAARQSWYPFFRRALPILGVDGTLYDIQRSSPARGKVFAKTGTDDEQDLLNDRLLYIKALAGYTTTRRGHHIAFAFSVNRVPVRLSIYPRKDGYHHTAELLGAMATATYLNY
ncbi:MAG TPA: D-alanyl-D-alanine carboxypeptidase/D-alanyl-D-alanine-endopeptidase [Candidatus Baltobacteraceae bacterium]|jgi:D-alanyl-D-alanine carboxypeptidase/D-alanyl-D-alanine-endopeptidase (penicillin-binding protein 4)|nr:D-alanyl-D-alanine carboxypeptidase/D-alanyl-D-alanine-endopeptidase [Candidatus Baltobacteraceae bacterium]